MENSEKISEERISWLALVFRKRPALRYLPADLRAGAEALRGSETAGHGLAPSGKPSSLRSLVTSSPGARLGHTRTLTTNWLKTNPTNSKRIL